MTRLLDMGMDPFNFADSLLARAGAAPGAAPVHAVPQQPQPATPSEIDELLADYMHAFGDGEPRAEPRRRAGRLARSASAATASCMHHRSPGCPTLRRHRLRGRAGLHELMVVSRELRHLIQTGARAEELQRTRAGAKACARCARTASTRCWPGVTTIEEVRATSNV